MKKRSTNLQLFRFIATALVIHWHSFTLTGSSVDWEILYRTTHGHLGIWHVGFYFLFLVAGYFAVTGVKRKPQGYLVARLKRIFPALWATVGFSMILGAIVTTLPQAAYWINPKTWLYLLNAAMIPVHGLPGVFEGHPHSDAVNGALWTLPVEFAGYVGIWLLWKLKLLEKKPMTILAPFVAIATVLLVMYGSRFGIRFIMVYPVAAFFLGALFATYEWKIPWLCFGCPVQVPEWMAKPGDITYEMYLLGFPIQQCIVEFAPNLSRRQHFIVAMVIDIALAFGLHMLLTGLLKKRSGKK